MKLRCTACNNDLNIPEHLGGKAIKCPMCGNRFNVPGSSAPGAPSAMPTVKGHDELSLTPIGEKVPEPQGPAKMEFCPNCGAKWKEGDSTCRKCAFNLALGRRLNPTAHRRRVMIPIDLTKVFLIALIVGAAYGIYYLYFNWGHIERAGKDAYDNASRAPVTTDSQSLLEKKGAQKTAQPPDAQPKPAVTPTPTTQTPAKSAGPEFGTLPVAERVAVMLADLHSPETYSRGKARAMDLVRNTEAVPLLAQALNDSWKDDAKDTPEFRMALATALATLRSADLAPTFAACLTVKGANGSQAGQLIALASTVLKGLGDAAMPAIEKALRDGDDANKIGALGACERNEWHIADGQIKTLLASANPRVKRAALGALAGKLRNAALLPEAVLALADKDILVANAASNALAALPKESAPLAAEALGHDAQMPLVRVMLHARPILAAEDGKGTAEIAARVRAIAGGVKAPETEAERTVFLKSDVQRATAMVRIAMGKSIEPSLAEPFAALLLADAFKLVRRRAALALSGTSGAKVAEALALACFDDDLQTAILAADAVAPKSDIDSAKPLLLAGLAEAGGYRRVCCAGMLYRQGTPEGAKVLREVAADESAAMADRALALRFLGKDLQPEEKALAGRLKGAVGGDPIVQRLLNSALAQTGDEKARAELYGNLKNFENDLQREIALQEVALISDTSAVQALLNELRAGNVSAAFAPVLGHAFGRFASPEVMQALLAAFASANDQTMDWMALAVARYGDAAVKPLEEALKNPSPRVRATAIAALAGIGTKATQAAAIKAMKEEKDPLGAKAGNRALAWATGQAGELSPSEWEVVAGGAKPNPSGKWSKTAGEANEIVSYSVPEELAAGFKGNPWPGEPTFRVSVERNANVDQQVSDLRTRLREGKPMYSNQAARAIKPEAKYGQNPPLVGLVWAEADRVYAVFCANLLEGENKIYVRVDFTCKPALWSYNEPLFEKLMSSVVIRKPK
ncbi:MAG: HEAT repeat domain-containing protein [Planctomycetes bacterium]|nr:HEAT repeat domain-containing protein [Planctomycetota bacterium]